MRLLLRLFLSFFFCSLAFAEDAVKPEIKALELAKWEGAAHIYRSSEKPVAIMVFASGDGGWTDWEDQTCQWLAQAGWWVAGLDCYNYARGHDYDGDLLSHDFGVFAQSLNAPPGTPLFYGGWSMGAVQAVAATQGEGSDAIRPKDLKGLLIISGDVRGRYGLRDSDTLGVTPRGDGTFALSDFNDSVKGLRIAQFEGGADILSNSTWIRTLPEKTALYELPGYDHGFGGPEESFHPHLLRSLGWLMGDDSLGPEVHKPLPFGLSPLWPLAALTIVLALIFIFSPKHALRLLVAAVLLIGVINLTEAMWSKSPRVIDWMQQWLPLGMSEDSRLLLVLSGVSLLGLARGLQRRKRMAWWLATILLATSAVLHLARAFDWHHSLASVVLLIPLIRWRREFVALSDAPSVRMGLTATPLIFFTLIVYGTLAIFSFGKSGKLEDPLDLPQSAKVAFHAVLAMSGGPDTSSSPEVDRFVGHLRFASLCCGTAIVLLLLRPVLARRSFLGTKEDRARAGAIAGQFGVDPTDPFTLLPDKRYYFHESPLGDGYVAYVVWRDMAVALGDPVGPEPIRGELVDGFCQFCHRQDWTPLFYGTRADSRGLYEPAGLVTFKVGEDARIPIAEFNLQGGKFQNLRTARNKAKKESLSFRWYDEKSGIDHGLEAQLKLVSDGWLASKKGGEMSFDLGSFSISDIRERGCSVILQPDGKVECFSTWIPYAGGKGRTLDIMRGRSSVSGVMDFLILESIDHFKLDGATEISLGNAPLANTETDPALLSREERRVKVLFERFDRFYGYKSLFDFKRKYHPAWQGRYLAYPPGTMLARIGLAVAAVHLPGGFRGLLRS